MFAMGRRAGMNVERTQHRPESRSRTGAPWHTRTWLPPGTPTSMYWKVVPVGHSAPHDDENGDDVPCPCAACCGLYGDGARGATVQAGGGGEARQVSGVNGARDERARALTGVLRAFALHPGPPASPSSSIPLPRDISVHSIPGSVPILARPPVTCPAPPLSPANVSASDLGGSIKSETHAGFGGALLRQ